ncbi:MAG TPA: hypothetical protein VJX91_00635 [Candidatus Eisenbacteria bacterium]|nr:hypothetical protein [Candidatus Eisenbacteria bacterium]
MNRYPRVVCVTVLCLSMGCSHLAQIPVEEELGHHGDQERPRVRIEGFTERDGTRVLVAGLATIRGDSFFVYPDEPSAPPGSIPRRLVALRRSEVDAVHVKEPSPHNTRLLVGGLVVGVLLALVIWYDHEISKPW